jgi:hypothetical protein
MNDMIMWLRVFAHLGALFDVWLYTHKTFQNIFLTVIIIIPYFFLIGFMGNLRKEHPKIHVLVYCCFLYYFYLQIGFLKTAFYCLFFAYDL